MSGIASGKLISRLGLSSVALAAGLIGGTAWAQDAAPPDSRPKPAVQANGQPVTDSTIIVTGSRVARSTFDTPQPVTVLNSQDIERLNLNNVAMVVQQLPSH